MNNDNTQTSGFLGRSAGLAKRFAAVVLVGNIGIATARHGLEANPNETPVAERITHFFKQTCQTEARLVTLGYYSAKAAYKEHAPDLAEDIQRGWER